MAKQTDLTEAARLLSQAANTLQNATNLPSSSHGSSSAFQSVPPATGVPRPSAQEEFRRLFLSSSRGQTSFSNSKPRGCKPGNIKRRKTTKDITIKLFCFASTTQEEVPTNEEKQELLVPGLGEKKMTMPADSNPSVVRERIKETFPKLVDSGGYEFLHARPSSRHLNLIVQGPDGFTIDYLKMFVGQGRVYIRPIQSDLDLEPEANTHNYTFTAEEICNHCLDIFPVSKLREHVQLCPKNKRNNRPTRPTIER